MASVLVPGGGQVASGGTKTHAPSMSKVLGELARTAESVGEVKKAAGSTGGRIMPWVAGITGAVAMAGAAVQRFIGFMPEMRKNKEQTDKQQLELLKESKKPFTMSKSISKSFKPNAEMCDESKQCFKAEVTKADKAGRFQARLAGGFTLKDCGTTADGSRYCKRDGKLFRLH